MLRVACLMMQKDEDLLLEPWARYHGRLFGFENLFVYDNGSTMPAVQRVLWKLEQLGVNVDRSYRTPRDFDNKGGVIGARIHLFKEQDRYDIALPLDCDEFICVTADTGFSCDADDIMPELARIAGQPKIAQISHSLTNRPGHLNLFALADLLKSIVPVRSFNDIDHGFHQASAVGMSGFLQTNIVYIHLHYKPLDRVLRHARDKLRPFVDTSDPVALQSYEGVGRHLVHYFVDDPDEYYENFGNYNYPVIIYDGLVKALALDNPIIRLQFLWCSDRPDHLRLPVNCYGRDCIDLTNGFNLPAYLAANLDVVASTMNGMVHYCLFGFREKRKTKPAAR